MHILPGQRVQFGVEGARIPHVGQGLGAGPVDTRAQGLVGQGVAPVGGVELAGQPGVAVEVELQPEGQPGRHPQMAQGFQPPSSGSSWACRHRWRTGIRRRALHPPDSLQIAAVDFASTETCQEPKKRLPV